MAKRCGTRAGAMTTASASTPQGELQRHLAALGLDTADQYRGWCRSNGFTPALEKSWHERRAERAHAERGRDHDAALRGMADHWKALGVAGEQEYFGWCRGNGFAEALTKTAAQKAQELLAHSRAHGALALAAARRFDRRPDELLRAIAAGTVPEEALKPPHLRAIHGAFSCVQDADHRDALLRLLLHCRRNGRLLSVDPAIASLGAHPANSYIGGLSALAAQHARWVNEPGSWKPDSHGARRQFGSLARHLLARYEVPVFMDEAWLIGADERGLAHQEWFIHIGRGANIRTAGLPIQLTRRAAHLFPLAPRDLSIEAALRWAQTLALGGDELLARALISTRLAELQPDEPFWQSVIFFFINNPMLDFARVGAIVDFVHHRRFVPAEAADPGGGPPRLAIPEPEFSMKGRTGIALLRRVEEWHRELARESKRPPLEWSGSGVKGLQWSYRDSAAKLDVSWTITELLSSRALQEEGRDMRHCVASYASSCARGTTSIWSLQVQEGATAVPRRVMTIELHNARRAITQARGRCNRAPGEKRSSARLANAPAIVRRWASEQSLTIPPHLFGAA